MKWQSCKTDPPEEGQKVLLHANGDIYVGMKIGDFYLPSYVTEEKYMDNLMNPNIWSFIEFPDGLEGKLKFKIDGKKKMYTLPEIKGQFPDSYDELCKILRPNRQKL